MATTVTNFPKAFEPQALRTFEDVEQELQAIAQTLRELPVGILALVKLHAAPS